MNSGRCFVVDDDELDASLAISSLTRMDFKDPVHVSCGLDDATEMLADAGSDDLIVLDLMLDGYDAFDVISALRKSKCRARVSIISGHRADYLKMAGMHARDVGLNVVGCFSKPVDWAAMKQQLDVAPADLRQAR